MPFVSSLMLASTVVGSRDDDDDDGEEEERSSPPPPNWNATRRDSEKSPPPPSPSERFEWAVKGIAGIPLQKKTLLPSFLLLLFLLLRTCCYHVLDVFRARNGSNVNDTSYHIHTLQRLPLLLLPRAQQSQPSLCCLPLLTHFQFAVYYFVS